MSGKKGGYLFGEIEPRWQGYWQSNRTFATADRDESRRKQN